LSQLHHLESTLASHRHSPFRSLSPPSSPIDPSNPSSPTTTEENYISSSPTSSRSHSRHSNRTQRYSPYDRPPLEETVEQLNTLARNLLDRIRILERQSPTNTSNTIPQQDFDNRLTTLEHLVERLSEPAPSPPSYSTPQPTASSPSHPRTPSPRGIPPPIARTAGPLSPSQRRREPQTHYHIEVWHHVFEGQTETYTRLISASSIRIYQRPNGEIHRVDVREHRH
jgi:hypothetical protein